MVLMIVGLLLGGLIVPLSAQMDQRRATETQKTLEEIKEALTGYAVINGQLPCPADPAIATGSAGCRRRTHPALHRRQFDWRSSLGDFGN